jgi:hypothetical protein
MRANWVTRTDTRIAQAAEVIGVSTDLIMAVMTEPYLIVLYTPEGSDLDQPTIYAQRIKLDADGVMSLDGLPELQPDMWEQVTRDVDEHMRRKFGDPKRRKRE